jgi:hypothetical protein
MIVSEQNPEDGQYRVTIETDREAYLLSKGLNRFAAAWIGYKKEVNEPLQLTYSPKMLENIREQLGVYTLPDTILPCSAEVTVITDTIGQALGHTTLQASETTSVLLQ